MENKNSKSVYFMNIFLIILVLAIIIGLPLLFFFDVFKYQNPYPYYGK